MFIIYFIKKTISKSLVIYSEYCRVIGQRNGENIIFEVIYLSLNLSVKKGFP